MPSTVPPPVPRHREWAELLDELTAQINRGAIYDRDFDELGPAFERLMMSLQRRREYR